MHLSKEELQLTVNTVRLHGSINKAAEAMGLARATVQNRVALAAKLGLTASDAIKATLPEGMYFERLSPNYGADGELKQFWARLKPQAMDVGALEEAFEKAFATVEPIPPVIRQENISEELLTLYPIIDHHLGLYAWEPEAGRNYDLGIAARILREALLDLMLDTPASQHAVILNIGDFFHRDNNRNRTDKSGNILDGDGRYAKVLEIGTDLMALGVEYALTKHECVELRNLPGNHDEYTTVALNIAMRQRFRDNPRVHISRDPSHFYFKQFGNVMIGATHGDYTKPEKLPGIMAGYAPAMWGQTLHKYAIQGHIHQYKGGEDMGVKWETFRTLASRDAWATNSGYMAGRGMVAITYHKETGEKYRHYHNITGKPYKEEL